MFSSTVLGASRARGATVDLGEKRLQALPPALAVTFGLERRAGRQQHLEIRTYFGPSSTTWLTPSAALRGPRPSYPGHPCLNTSSTTYSRWIGTIVSWGARRPEEQEQTINTTRRATLRASTIGAAAAVSLTAMLAAGGTAQAETSPTYFTNPDNSLEVIYGGGGLALYATIVDTRNPPGATEVCHYHSVGVMSTPALPYEADTTVHGPSPSRPVTIIFQQQGGTYGVNVTCYGTGNSASYSPVVY